MAIRLGLSLPQMKQFDIGRDIPAVARAAEDIGYESVWVFERVLFPTPMRQGLAGIEGLPWPDAYRSVAEPLVSLSLAAAVTERVKLGTSVLVAPLHVPFELARALATLDRASGGRVVAGLGTGWAHDEYAAQGVAPFSRRGQVLDELLDVCAAVWGPDPVSYEGELTQIVPSEVGPKPVRPIPVHLPAFSPRATRRLVRRADGWMPIAMGAPQLAAAWQGVRDMAAEHGRERPVDVTVRVNARLLDKPYEGDDREPFQGSLDQLVEDLAAHARVVPGTYFFDLQNGARDGEELKDRAAAVYEAVAASGI
ncbi:LLM class F420-dependent oxidoreductase [Streptomyces sp. N35]|uniref:LLM class F420-dependent oxidoreductase n=1 Tax=Streptomyces sp. N35 TaxID=2795730 RepID=UPI0018F6D478|nr:LLM class F420-dependent oxidoreductase [Streptomyces sp. N35]